MATKKTFLEKLVGTEKAKQLKASWKMNTFSRYAKALEESNKEFLKTGKFKYSQELVDATNEFKLLELNEKRNNRGVVNRKNASLPRKAKPSKSELLNYEAKFLYDHGSSRGWKKSAMIEFSLDSKTLNKILE